VPRAPIFVASDTPLREAIRTLTDKKIGCVLVVDGGDLVGILTERDVLMNIAGHEAEYGNDMVREWMTRSPETVAEDDSIAFAIHKMDIGGYRHLPVMESGQPVGIISVRDVVRYLATYLSPTAS
jgi:CBS domain-containing protein